MSRKLIAILSVFVVLSMMTTTVFAGFKGRNIKFELDNSVKVTGTFTGVGSTDVQVDVFMTGDADITCTNNGENFVPGQNPNVSAEESIELHDIVENGRNDFTIIVQDPAPPPPEEVCPNGNWNTKVEFVDWNFASITVTDLATEEVIFKQTYDCKIKDKDTPNPSLSCTPQAN